LAVIALLAVPSAAGAATFTVTSTADSGPGSLRQAIATADDETANPGRDVIQVTATGIIHA